MAPQWLVGTPMAAPMAPMVVAEAVLPTGIALEGTGQAEMTLIEQVEVFKRQLGLSGTVSEVVHQAAEQLGVAAEGEDISALATACMQELSDRV